MDTKKGCVLNVLLFGFGAVIGTGLTAVAAVVLFLPAVDTVSTDEGTPNVYVKERSRLVGGTEHEVWLGRGEDHGHVVEVPGGWGADPEVVRQEGGVELRFDGGGRIFVPEADYLGGR
ncbi:hypothetical protein [Saccharothrix longispora]|uniref:hypothetical protein n=1 Tax=Saccharothrix longispora TaxID=33920 RepID=UPI0028FD3F91|nr:hypothetical protein [Saccharothrix longispora]MBY8847466.1 hypothetical protein [Saccharothrix sp. MB29]MDU0288790.1 hypothetical protein [Saccharothrix longispora]